MAQTRPACHALVEGRARYRLRIAPTRELNVGARASPSGKVAQAASAEQTEFAQLLSPVPTDVFGPGRARARSASDAGVLRRKGRLKEQDQLIDFIVAMHQTHTCEEAMHKVEQWIQVRPQI